MSSTPEPTAAAARHVPRASAAALRSVRRLTRRKDRRATGECLVEGRQAVREALRYGTCHRLWVAEDQVEAMADLIDLATEHGVDSCTVSAADLAGLCDAVTAQGVVAHADSPEVALPEHWPQPPSLVVICAQVRDPGNAGTIIRCADAFGADAVILTGGSVELTNAKTIRASVGSIFHLPVITGPDLPEAIAACREAGLQVLAADGSSGPTLDDLTRAELAAPTAWVLGNEAWGLPADDVALADRSIGVPMYGLAESLNVSTAAAICLFSTARAQRG
ncbi:TrmH family RNA methyltransferase [Enemella sp. A6]|uniref:TrmH family RNA methyltransferase n=1 Tax=Enemella sp. A6 TaxID=3440152 RepID=UPI003EBC349C